MARGNRAYGQLCYGRALYDDGHRALFLRHAYLGLNDALACDSTDVHGIDPSARPAFTKLCADIESVWQKELLQAPLDIDEFSLGDSTDEARYRSWCLAHRLFLNPINDLGNYSLAAHDVLTTPSMAAKLREGPHFQGFYNQLKQEYVSARYFYFDGVTSTTPHFSDKGVLLYNTLDYPSYSLAVEKVKVAFRIVYSLFDKIAFFLNHFLSLGIPERQVTFRSFWYVKQDRSRGLRAEFENRENWPLRGLFWLSKDLFEKSTEFKECLEPDAEELDVIRNHAEHKYLKLHELLLSRSAETDESFSIRTDKLAYSLRRTDFEAKALRLLKMSRAALIYLSLAIHNEEGRRKESRPQDAVFLPMFLDTWRDEWKQ